MTKEDTSGYIEKDLEVESDERLKIQFRRLMLLVTWMVKKLLEVFAKKNFKKLVKKNLEWEKYLKEKVTHFTSDGKVMIIVLIVRLIKKISYKNEWILS